MGCILVKSIEDFMYADFGFFLSVITEARVKKGGFNRDLCYNS